jgi:hypothetical protein
MAPKLHKNLTKSQEVAYTATLGLGGQIMQHAKDFQKTSITVHYMKHLAPVRKLEVLVIPMRANHLVL